MANIIEYETKKGTRYKVQGYLGIDPLTGKQKNLNKGGFLSEKDARLFLADATMALNQGTFLSRECNMTYEEVYREWFELHSMEVKGSTQNLIKKHFKTHILPKFGEMRINRITAAHIQKVAIVWVKSYAIGKQLVQRTLKVFEYAVKMGYIAHNPKDKFTMPRKPNSIDDDENICEFYDKETLTVVLKTLEQHATPQWYTFFRLLAFSGMRKGEALSLTWEDIDFTAKTIRITKTLTTGLNNVPIIQTAKTKTSKRKIQIDDATLSVLKRWKKLQAEQLLANGFNAMNDKQLVFCKMKKNILLYENEPYVFFSRFCKEHGLKRIKIHGFRHTHATLLLESGASMKVVQKRLGHTNIATTMNIYAHITQQMQDESVKNFSKHLGL